MGSAIVASLTRSGERFLLCAARNTLLSHLVGTEEDRLDCLAEDKLLRSRPCRPPVDERQDGAVNLFPVGGDMHRADKEHGCFRVACAGDLLRG